MLRLWWWEVVETKAGYMSALTYLWTESDLCSIHHCGGIESQGGFDSGLLNTKIIFIPAWLPQLSFKIVFDSWVHLGWIARKFGNSLFVDVSGPYVMEHCFDNFHQTCACVRVCVCVWYPGSCPSHKMNPSIPIHSLPPRMGGDTTHNFPLTRGIVQKV